MTDFIGCLEVILKGGDENVNFSRDDTNTMDALDSRGNATVGEVL
ncbi:MAG: hypothetical protein WAU89_08195 [Candidatus Acidiferrales bacterium]